MNIACCPSDHDAISDSIALKWLVRYEWSGSVRVLIIANILTGYGCYECGRYIPRHDTRALPRH